MWRRPLNLVFSSKLFFFRVLRSSSIGAIVRIIFGDPPLRPWGYIFPRLIYRVLRSSRIKTLIQTIYDDHSLSYLKWKFVNYGTYFLQDCWKFPVQQNNIRSLLILDSFAKRPYSYQSLVLCKSYMIAVAEQYDEEVCWQQHNGIIKQTLSEIIIHKITLALTLSIIRSPRFSSPAAQDNCDATVEWANG